MDGDQPKAYEWAGSPGRDEDEVRREVQALEDFAFADAVSTILAVALENAGEARQRPDYAGGLRELAVLHASVRAYRAIRAGLGVLASGYALEAEVYTRILLELFVSAKAAHHDPTENEARRWLAGKRGQDISGRVKAQMSDESVYGYLSQAAHGDPRALPRGLLAESDGERVIQWGPARTRQPSSSSFISLSPLATSSFYWSTADIRSHRRSRRLTEP